MHINLIMNKHENAETSVAISSISTSNAYFDDEYSFRKMIQKKVILKKLLKKTFEIPTTINYSKIKV